MPEKKGGAGPIIAIVVIVLILAFGGLYYLADEISRIRSGAEPYPSTL